MGLLDELKKLTKPYDDEDYLEEDLAEPVRAPGRAADGVRARSRPSEAAGAAHPNLCGNTVCADTARSAQ